MISSLANQGTDQSMFRQLLQVNFPQACSQEPEPSRARFCHGCVRRQEQNERRSRDSDRGRRRFSRLIQPGQAQHPLDFPVTGPHLPSLYTAFLLLATKSLLIIKYSLSLAENNLRTSSSFKVP